MMIFVNLAEKDGLTKDSYHTFLRLLAPFAPHITEELHHEAGNEESIHLSEFPTPDHTLTIDEEVTIGVQINGKVRGDITISPEASEEDALVEVNNNPNLKARLAEGKIKKVIYKPGKILNIIVS